MRTAMADRRLSRRTLLAGAAAGLALPFVSSPAPARPAFQISSAAWRDLAARVGGPVVRPGDAAYRALTTPQNLRYDTNAALAVVQPRDAQGVGAAIVWARERGMPLVARSGGHSYAGCSTIGGLVIHTGAMRGVRHLGDRLIDMQGGALNGDAFAALETLRGPDQPEGLAITHGRCAGVGASAFLMGGGIGFAMRDRGLGCDLVEAVDLVLADGSAITASVRDNADLFWAARGGAGGNLGIATGWRLRAVAAEPVTVFRLQWRQGSEQAYAALVRAIEAGPDRMGVKLTIFAQRPDSKEPNLIDVLGQLRGTEEELRAILAPALAAAMPTRQDIRRMPYWQAQAFLGFRGGPNRYQEKSLFAPVLPDRFIEQAFRLCRTWPGTSAIAILTIFHMGGRIRAVAPADTAYVHRSAEWLVNSDVDWTEKDSPATTRASLDWQQRLQAALADMLGDGGSYQNFTDPTLRDAPNAYWGENLTRLRAIKRTVDPDNIFTPPRGQGIMA